MSEEFEKIISKSMKYVNLLSRLSVFLDSLEGSYEKDMQAKDALEHRLHEVEVELRSQVRLTEDLVAANQELSRRS